MKALAILLLFILLPVDSESQTLIWKNGSGTGPDLHSIVKGPDRVLYGLLSGKHDYAVRHLLFTSADNGITWQQRGLKYFTSNPSLYCTAEGLLLVATGDSGFVSDDNGISWTYDADQRLVTDVVRSRKNTLYTNLYYSLSKSTNSGLDWTIINSAVEGDYALCVDSVGRLWTSNKNSRQLQYSLDDGLSWIPVSSMQANNRVRCGVDGTVYIVGNGHYSQTGYKKDELNIVRPGSSEPEFVCHLIGRVWSFNLNGSTILYVSDSGCFRSSDGGATWNRSGVASENSDVHLWVVGEGFDSVIFCGSLHEYQYPKSRLHRSTNFGTSWRECGNSMKNRVKSSLAALASGQFVIGGLSVISTTDEGLNWVTSREFERMNSLHAARDILFVGIYGAGWRSSDLGVSWDSLRIETNGRTYDVRILCVDSNQHIFAQLGDLHRSVDLGQSWSPVHSTLDDRILWQMEYLPDDSYLAMTSDHELFVSSDVAKTWREVTPDVASFGRVNRVYSARPNSFFASTERGRLLRSNDRGERWDLVLSVDSSVLCLSQSVSGELLVGTLGCGLWSSSDNGNNWVRADSNLPKRARFQEIAFVPGSNTVGVLTQDSFYLSTEPMLSVGEFPRQREIRLGYVPSTRSLGAFSDRLSARVGVTDATGRLVLESTLEPHSSLYLGMLSKGVYWVDAWLSNGEHSRQKIVIPQ